MNNIHPTPKRCARWWMMCLTLMLCVATKAQDKIEYFWNTDPGVGKGNKVAVTDGRVNFDVNTASLPTGPNLLGIRAIDDGHYSSTLLRTIFKVALFAENAKVEYFWDTDPGVGNATNYPVALSGSDVSVTLALPTTNVSNGAHLLGMRVYNGYWSHTHYYIVVVANNGALADKVEYFWDVDPGMGKGIQQDVTVDGTSAIAALTIPTDTLKGGVHLLGMRVGCGDTWSSTITRIVAIAPNDGAIESIEYFWNNDPGIGNAAKYELSESENTGIVSLSIPTDTLNTGVHLLGMRSFCGEWSATQLRYIAVSATGNAIERIEYFWDTDPGIGNATEYKLGESNGSDAVSLSIPTDTLSTGVHLLGMRSYCGGWSATLLRYIAVSTTGGAIERVEYYWDEDPGYGQATELPYSGDVMAIVDTEVVPPTDYGTHVLHIRAYSNGMWSTPYIQTFCMNATPGMELPKDTVCVGEQFIVYNMTEGATDATTYSWDMNGDGKEDSNADDAFVYSYTKAGTYMASLSVKTVGNCATTCYVPVVVLPTDAPKVTLSAAAKTICANDVVRLKATATSAGDKPEYEWIINGEVVATTLVDTLMMEGLAHNDKVQVRVISSNPCASIDNALSSTITFRVNPLPEVSIAHYFPVYTSEAALILTGGMPEGGTYYINDEETQLFNPKRNEAGTYKLRYSYTNGNGCTSEAVTSFVLRDGSSLQKGDVNKDEHVDVMDILCEVDLIYGRIFPTYTLATADLNGDNTVNVTDIVGISGIILGEPAVARALSVRDRASSAESYTLKALDATGIDEVLLHFTLSSTASISGVQFDVTMPEGVDLTSATPGLVVGRKPGTEDNTYTLLAYSTSLGSVPSTLSVKATLPVNMVEGTYPIVPSEAILVDADMSEKPCMLAEGELMVGNATDIEVTTTDIRVKVIDEGLRIFGATGSVAMITDAAGRFVLAEEVTKEDFLIALSSLPAGTYVVEIVNETSPIKVKFLWK